ncbi:MAG: oligoribonuclease [Bdellovibrionota bacterium]
MEKLLWIDMEMTGLDVTKEVPIEIAAIVTDLDFKELENFHAIIKQPKEFLERMDEWNTRHHGASGLTAQVPLGTEPTLVETQMIQLIDRHFLGERPVIAGNSIGQDRLFINKYFPAMAAKLHYRMLDVTSWKILMNEKYDIMHEKKNAHRAVDDIRESIAEMAFYLQYVQPTPTK